jgi:hypothetical protein
MECEILPSEFVFPLNTSERWRHPIIDKTLPVNQVRVRTKCRNGGAYCDSIAVINAEVYFQVPVLQRETVSYEYGGVASAKEFCRRGGLRAHGLQQGGKTAVQQSTG